MTSLSVASILAEAARRRPAKIAVVGGPQRVSYADLWEQSRRYGAGLVSVGVGPGDKVALMAPNVIDFVRSYYGGLSAGAVVVPIHLLLTTAEVAYVLTDSQATTLICHSSQLAVGAAAAAQAGVRLICVGPIPEPPEGLLRLETLSAEIAPLPTFISRQAEDPAVILYTSGTTGQPKGAVLSQLNLVLNAAVSAFDCNDSRPEDVVLGCLPLFHSFGQTVSMNGTFRLGGTLVLMPRFAGPEALDLMIAEKVDSFQGVPTMYIGLLAAAAGRTDLPKLRLCVSGGASLPMAVLDKFEDVFGAHIFEGYGLSETSPVATTNQPHFGTRAGTVGHPVWGVEVEIARAEIEDHIELLPTGELGEVVIRGHNVFTEYLNRPAATAEAVVDGWFRTGDLGTRDAQGFISIVDRKKDIIIRGGFNVYPREVEEVMAGHPAVAQVAVIGTPDDVHGEEICAVLVLQPGLAAQAVPTPEELIQWARQRLGKHMYPRQIRIMEQLPMGPSMKVLKRELRAQLS